VATSIAFSHVGQAEPPSDDPAVPKELLDLVGMRRGADVEVLGLAAQQQVADAAAHEVGGVVPLVQPVQDPEGVRIDLAPSTLCRGARHDHGFAHQFEIVLVGVHALET
jgi:hypothetical protein